MLFGKKKKKAAEEAAKKAEHAAVHAAGHQAGKEQAERDAAQKRSEAAKKAAATRAANKAEYYKMLLERGTAGEKFSTALVEISYRKSTEVVVDDMFALPFIYVTNDIKPDKVAIKEALKRGETVVGAHLTDKKNIQIK